MNKREMAARGGFETEHWPTDIRVRRAERRVDVTFETGETFSLPAELLRVESPSAEVQGHNPRQKQIVPGKRHVGLEGAEPVGRYAIRLIFDDGHSSGIFSWKYLYDLGRRQDEVWQRYLDALAERGLSRDPA